MSKVFIFGCGYLGMRLADTLIAAGHEVGALTKNENFAKVLKARGITEVIVDRLESDSGIVLLEMIIRKLLIA